MEVIRQKIKSLKGEIATVISYPKNNKNKLAILCPGYLDSKDYEHLVMLSKELNDLGFTVVRFDPIGTWDSDGVISDYTNSQYLNDIKVVIDYMLTKSVFNQIIIGGHSRGGQISILYAARDQRINLVLGIMASSGSAEGNFRLDWEEKGAMYSQRDFPFNKEGKKEYYVPFSHVLDADRYDVIKDVKNINIPIILIAGELDDIVTPNDVKEIFDSANEPKEFIFLKNIGHNYRNNKKEIRYVNENIVNTLNKYL